MNENTVHNIKVFKVGLNGYAERVIKARLVAMLKSVAQELVAMIDRGFVMPTGTVQFPVYTANLHDATGVGVYVDGAIMHFVPTKRATKPQSMGRKTNIIGSELLKAAITDYSSRFAKGIWIVLFSTVPYAYMINEEGSKFRRGIAFFEVFKESLLKNVITGLKPIAV